jgi:hypothetical protein
MAYGLLFAIPKVTCLRHRRIKYSCYVYLDAQTLLDQFQRDDNIQTLLEAVRDAFDFANRKTLSKPSSVFPGKHKSLRTCCSMSVAAVTLFDRTQRIRNSVSNLYPFQWPT